MSRSGEAICDAAFLGDLAWVKELVRLGTSPDQANGDGKTPLHLAIENLSIEVVRFLLDSGADAGGKDASGWTPLYHAVDVESDAACQCNSVPSTEILEVLLAYGADPNEAVSSSQWKTPLQLARMYGNDRAEKVLLAAGARG